MPQDIPKTKDSKNTAYNFKGMEIIIASKRYNNLSN